MFPSYLKIICNYIFFINSRGLAFLTVFKCNLVIKVYKNTNISPPIITFQVLGHCVLIREVSNGLTDGIVVADRVVVNEEIRVRIN